MGISPREGVLFGANLELVMVTSGDFTAYVCDGAATQPSSQITLGKLVQFSHSVHPSLTGDLSRAFRSHTFVFGLCTNKLKTSKPKNLKNFLKPSFCSPSSTVSLCPRWTVAVRVAADLSPQVALFLVWSLSF